MSERLRGVFARQIPASAPIPLLATRRGARDDGPVALIDVAPVTLEATAPRGDAEAYSDVGDVFLLDPGSSPGPVRGVRRSGGAGAPLISALVTTHERPELLAGCLEGFCDQDLPVSDFEVVVVDDGSSGPETGEVLASFAERLPLTWTRIEHAGRSAAKNLAVMLARGEIVLFFDDDDVPAADLLGEHVRAHGDEPGEAVAVLGHTEWDPAIAVTPLMNFITEVDKLMFAYGNLSEDERGDWRRFWEGRISSKRGAPPAPRPARPAPRLFDRHRDGLAAGGSRPRGGLQARRAQRHVEADRPSRTSAPARRRRAARRRRSPSCTTTRSCAST